VRPRSAVLAWVGVAVAVLAIGGAGAWAAVPASAANPQTSLSEVSSEVMCPVCGTLLELAESPQAQREKAFVSRLVAAGRSKEQIKDALVAEYGTEVLALPQGSGFDLSAYLVPAIAFVIAAVALAFGVLRWRRAGQRADDRGPSAAAGPSPEDAERLEADLARYDL
jgi:cytochrome c-type biogenesis protein CcmH